MLVGERFKKCQRSTDPVGAPADRGAPARGRRGMARDTAGVPRPLRRWRRPRLAPGPGTLSLTLGSCRHGSRPHVLPLVHFDDLPAFAKVTQIVGHLCFAE